MSEGYCGGAEVGESSGGRGRSGVVRKEYIVPSNLILERVSKRVQVLLS